MESADPSLLPVPQDAPEPVANIHSRLPWERLRDEPTHWFQRFSAYRKMGPGRTFAAAYRQDRVKRGVLQTNRNPSNIPVNWQVAIKRYQWKVRAEAWDSHERQAEEQDWIGKRKASRALRIEVGDGLLQKAQEALQHLSPEKAKWSEVIQAVRYATELLRTEYDDIPAQRVDLTMHVRMRARQMGMDEEEAAMIANEILGRSD